MIWIGDRTRQPDHAHVEYCRGIKNPLGLKCGPSLTADGLLQLIDLLNPENEPGRLTLIARFGSDKVERASAAADPRRADAKAATSCGRAIPMHGNTITLQQLQDAAVRPHPQGGADLLRGAPRRGHASGRHPYRDDRQERHRMHRRRARHHAPRICTTATTRIATRASTPTRRSSWLSWCRSC